MSKTDTFMEICTDSLREAIAAAWQDGYNLAKADIATEIRLTLRGNTVFEEELLEKCALIAEKGCLI